MVMDWRQDPIRALAKEMDWSWDVIRAPVKEIDLRGDLTPTPTKRLRLGRNRGCRQGDPVRQLVLVGQGDQVLEKMGWGLNIGWLRYSVGELMQYETVLHQAVR
jgi:hypothetical protein